MLCHPPGQTRHRFVIDFTTLTSPRAHLSTSREISATLEPAIRHTIATFLWSLNLILEFRVNV
jgi:hypothetical protein